MVKHLYHNILIDFLLLFFLFIMDGDGKKPLKIVIAEFYKLHKAKGKEYTFKQFKKFGFHKATIY